MTTLEMNDNVENTLKMAVYEVLLNLSKVDVEDILKSLSARHKP